MNNSPRETLIDSCGQVLARIKTVDGFLTDAGLQFTEEPAPVVGDEAGEFITVVWDKQERATDPALLRTHRLTTVRVIAKVKASLTNAQERLDALVTDIEAAFEKQQFRFPVGYQFPQYQSAEPLAASITAGWVGAAVTYTSHIPIRRPAA